MSLGHNSWSDTTDDWYLYGHIYGQIMESDTTDDWYFYGHIYGPNIEIDSTDDWNPSNHCEGINRMKDFYTNRARVRIRIYIG